MSNSSTSEAQHNATAVWATKSRRGPVPLLFLLGAIITCLAFLYPESLVSFFPFPVLYCILNLKKGLKEVLLSLVYSVVLSGFSIVMTLPLRMWFGPIATALTALLPLVMFISILARRKPWDVPGGIVGRFLMRLFWDLPLMITVWIAWTFFGVPFLHDGKGDFVSVIDEDIVMSSMPLARHQKELQSVDVVAVVNMQLEYSGPVHMYSQEEVGITQLHLPTLDTDQPLLEDLERGIAFILEQKQKNPNSRVLVHCKGGRGRAATMVMSWLISGCGGTKEPLSIPDAFSLLRSKRHVCEPVVQTYPVLQELKIKLEKQS